MARSARLRLTLLYSGMFLALGTAIVVVIFLLGSHGTVIGSSSSSIVGAVPAPDGHAPIVRDVVSQQHSADVDRLLAASWVTLAVTAVVAAVLGWFLAGRVLRPLREMTASAQTISAGNLHERLALTGPDDEFKQLGNTFDDLLGRLEASFAAQRRFVANAAHELRTPLTVERTVLQVALADPDASAASLRAACEELLASGRDHQRLLDSLLTLATSERGLSSGEPIGLAAVAEAVLESSRPEIEQRSLTIAAALQPVTINGDRALIESLVANLIDNAIRYSEPAGRVEVGTSVDGGHAVLTVVNSGPQIPESEIERLFEPFRRLTTDRTTADGHHGLGLSIVRAVATAHRATVAATPGPDGGLAMTVSFPNDGETLASGRS
ncbi:MAG TPA: HAMP domain-containing sensor histidine kinase [Solirubrobacteraceae bacterium]|nr:HAMP domain-containing sensor histidine kinase [Solirubrobacteraceae bacterium]